MKKILLVEDEVHKRDELTDCLKGFYKDSATLETVDSVHAAFWSISVDRFDLIILDMALPTFSADGGATERGHDQALGGVEVLRALKSQCVSTQVILITQYPDITVGGTRIKISAAPDVLRKRYGQDVVGSVLYKYRSPSNAAKLTALLKKLI